LSNTKKNFIILIRDIVIALVIVAIFMLFIKPTIVREHSMESTLNADDYIFLNKQAYTFKDAKYGDVVVFGTDLVTKTGMQKKLIKRVIGVPGDKVAIREGGVYVNDILLEEPYTHDGVTEGTMDEVTVPEDRLFLLGDNRQHSIDSRDPSVGFVSEDDLVGKAIFRLFPLNDAGIIK
jgi:signal peptidase I